MVDGYGSGCCCVKPPLTRIDAYAPPDKARGRLRSRAPYGKSPSHRLDMTDVVLGKSSVESRIAELRILPLVELPDASQAPALTDALVAGGLPCVEVALRTSSAVSALELITRSHPDVLVGAGTVRSVGQVDLAVSAGAHFIVSPGFDPTVVDYCIKRSVVIIPGVATATEVEMALKRSLTTVKFFPAEAAGGVAYLRALAGPFPHLHYVPSGGINMTNLERYLTIPQVVAVGGSWMVARDTLRVGDFTSIERLVREAVESARRTRAGLAVDSAPARPTTC